MVRQAQAISTNTSRRTEKHFRLLLRNTIIREEECGLLHPKSNQVPDVCGQHRVDNEKDEKTPRWGSGDQISRFFSFIFSSCGSQLISLPCEPDFSPSNLWDSKITLRHAVWVPATLHTHVITTKSLWSWPWYSHFTDGTLKLQD